MQPPPFQFPIVPHQATSTSPKFSLTSITGINEHNPLLPRNNDTPPYSHCDIEMSLMRKLSSHNYVSSL